MGEGEGASPPGGDVWTAVVRAPIDPAAVLSRVGASADGAVLLFLGTVRDHDGGRPVTGMCYDAYVEMAEGVLRRVATEAAMSRGAGSVAAVHRIGALEVGEVSVAVAVSSRHRAEAYQASRHVIEEIKKRLPVWKKEFYAGGDAAWVEGRVPTP